MPGVVIHPGYPRTWSGQSNEKKHREYRVVFLVQVGVGEGPHAALSAVGLPTIGSPYSVMNDSDAGAWCRPNARALLHEEKEGEGNIWAVEVTYSSEPLSACADQDFDNPLLEPYRLDISSTRYSEEGLSDRFGNPILYSSHEQIRGPMNEWDASRWVVKITLNVVSIDMPLLTSMMDTVNSIPLWGSAPRTIKLSGGSISRKFYGLCFPYYELGLEFEHRREGWDRAIADEGTKFLRGQWKEVVQSDGSTVLRWQLLPIGYQADGTTPIMPDPNNPSHFRRAVDVEGNPVRMLLDGFGKPYDPHLDPVMTCDQCPDGAARQWIVSGFNGTEYARFDGLALEYGAGCSWAGEIHDALDDITFTLENAGGAVWFLNNGRGQEWSNNDEANGQCTGTNTLHLINPALPANVGWPATLTIRDGTSDPGTIFVQKYGESNFFLLGIPAILQ